MDYEITTYEEGYIEQQAKIGLSVTEDWLGYGQSNEEALKQAYQDDDFDPSTRFYAFKGDKMVGFMTSNISKDDDNNNIADCRFPICREGYEDAIEPLMKKAIQTWKNKNVKKVTTIVKEDWDDFIGIAENYGFEFDSEGSVFSQQNLDSIVNPTSNYSDQIKEVDAEKDSEALFDIFINAFGMSEEAAKNNLEAINAMDKNQLITHSVIYEEDRIVGRIFAYKPNPDDDMAYLGNIFDGTEDNIYFDTLLSHALNMCEKDNISKVTKFRTGDDKSIKMFKKYGFEFDQIVKNYIKYLDS